jgi:DNA-binding transcriptional ArsR family regulator
MDGGLKVFGSVARTRIMVATLALRETYPREVARLTAVPLVTVQRIVDELERQGIVVSRLSGNQRRVTVNPEWIAADELRALALRLLDVMPDLRAAIDGERRRPRRAGKPRDRSGRDAA